jgi:hypothetical protein
VVRATSRAARQSCRSLAQGPIEARGRRIDAVFVAFHGIVRKELGGHDA